MNNIQQIQMMNGQEVIADIQHWQEDTFIEANNILELIPINELDLDPEETKSYYILKPWITYTDDLTKSTTINPAAVMCMTDPSPTVLEQYNSSLEEITRGMEAQGEAERESIGNVVSFLPKKQPSLLTE
jgi:hypothetical protein